MPTLEPESVDLIITDPPYPKEYNYLWEPLAIESSRVLKVGGNLITMLGHYQLPLVIKAFEPHLRFWWIMWKNQKNINRLIGKGVAVRGKPVLWYVKEKRRPLHTYGYPFDTLDSVLAEDKESKKIHKWGQPVGWYIHYINELTQPGEIVLDPFMGSGTCAVACKKLGRQFIGIDIDPVAFEGASQRVNAAPETSALQYQLKLE